MLDPEYLAHCTDEIEQLFADLESDILADIARRIAENDYQNTSTAQHQLNRLKAMGVQYDEVQKMLSEKLELSMKKISEIISESSYGSVERDNVIFKEAHDKGIVHHFNYDKEGLKKIILEGIASTEKEIRNICKTSATTSQSMLTKYLDQVYMSVSSGAFSQQEAVKTAVNDLARQGLRWIDYRSGSHRRLDTAVRTALRSGINQTACKCQDRNFELMGGNLVEVTSHMGARPSHAEWQGKIYWRKKKYKNYQNFEEATRYGTGDGLGGWNCRHSFYPYFEGLSNKSFEHYRLSENEERYELDQEQRYNERKIREWKRRRAVNKAGGVDTTLEARKVREWENKQRQFLKDHPEMKRNYARETVEKNSVSVKEAKMAKKQRLLDGYYKAIGKGDISSFVKFDTYNEIAEEIEKELVGLKAKDGIIIKGYKTHFIDRIIGQYESSNEPVKGMRKGVSIKEAKAALLSGIVKDMPLRKNGKPSRRYITDTCFVTVNPITKELIQVTPKR